MAADAGSRQYFAHSDGSTATSERHPFTDHAEGVADRAAVFLQRFGRVRLARARGLLHDVGKITDSPRRSRSRRGGPSAGGVDWNLEAVCDAAAVFGGGVTALASAVALSACGTFRVVAGVSHHSRGPSGPLHLKRDHVAGVAADADLRELAHPRDEAEPGCGRPALDDRADAAQVVAVGAGDLGGVQRVENRLVVRHVPIFGYGHGFGARNR